MSVPDHKRAELDLLCSLDPTYELPGTIVQEERSFLNRRTDSFEQHAVRYDLLSPVSETALNGMTFEDGLRVLMKHINMLQLRVSLLEQQLHHVRSNSE